MLGTGTATAAVGESASFAITDRERRLIQAKRRLIISAKSRLRRPPPADSGRGGDGQPDLVPPPAVAAHPPGFAYRILEFSYYRGVLHVRGWASSPDGIAAVGYMDGDGSPVEIGRFPAEVVGGRRDFDFDVPETDRAAAMRTELFLELDSGVPVTIQDVARVALAADPVSELNARFRSDVGALNTPRILEVGARARSGNIYRSWLPEGSTYVGFDLVDGENVDVIGDAHRLSTHLPPDSFDAIYSVSTMEHLAMPWIAASEMNKVLKPGGLVFVASNQTWPVHDAPWDFYRFSQYSWVTLFNRYSGFEIVDVAAGEPAQVVANIFHPSTNGLEFEPAFLSSAVLARKIGPTNLVWAADPSDLVAEAYPG